MKPQELAAELAENRGRFSLLNFRIFPRLIKTWERRRPRRQVFLLGTPMSRRLKLGLTRRVAVLAAELAEKRRRFLSLNSHVCRGL